MKKLVPESIEEAVKYKGQPLNEGIVEDWFNSAKNLIQGVFKKVGKFFVGVYKDKIQPVILSVNIAILYKSGKLPKSVTVIPSNSDIELEPSLSSLKNGYDKIAQQAKQKFEMDARKNRARGGLKNYRPFSFSEAIEGGIPAGVNEAMVELKYTSEKPKDVLPNINSKFLTNHIKVLIMERNEQFKHDPLMDLKLKSKQKINLKGLLPPLIWGAPGIGKTAITNSVLRDLGPAYTLIDIQTSQMAPDDWQLPNFIKMSSVDGEGEIMSVDVPKNWLPVYKPTKDPEENARRNDLANRGEGGIIFLDELSRASPEVQNTCLKLVHERKIGESILGSKWVVVAATNRELDDPDGNQTQIGSALANRFMHFNFIPSVDEWITWGQGEGIDPRILTFVDFNRDHFYFFDTDAKPNTSPRTWECLSSVLQLSKKYGGILYTKADIESMMQAAINAATYERLNAFLILIETFHPDEIKMVFTDPKKAPKPITKSGVVDHVMAKALIGAILSSSEGTVLTGKQVENYVQYWVDLGDESLAPIALLMLVGTHDYIHAQIGEDPKKAEYKKAMDIFRVKFGGIKFSNRAEIMGL